MRTIKTWICLSLLASSSSWTGPPMTRRSVQDQMMLPILGTIGATVIAACSPNQQAVAAETALLPATSNDVLWRTLSKQALPATPSSLSEIVRCEMLGFSDISSGILCVSERHDDYEHHKVQLKVLMTMKKVFSERSQVVSERMSIGMEMFQRRHQMYLDKYIAKSNDYSIEDLRRDTNWQETWGYDLLHYLPVLTYAQNNNIRILGLHPSDEEVDWVQKHGLRDASLSGISTSDRKHAEEFRRSSMLSLSGTDNKCQAALDAALMRQYEVQCFREEYMAETAAIQMAIQPDGWIALLAGERHILGRNGLPFRALRRSTNIRKNLLTPLSLNRGVFTIVPKTSSFAANDAPGMDLADYVWYVPRDPSYEFKEHEVNRAPRL